MNRVSRGEKILQRIVESGLISQSGRDFLLAALDPMHDTQLTHLEGWPDVCSAPSVVRCVKQSQSISAVPGTLTNWDCQIVQWPFLNSLTFGACTRVNNVLEYPAAEAQFISTGGLSVYQTATTSVNLASDPTFQIVLPTEYSAGAHRIIGVGIEITNTTSELYRQGQIIVWRQANPCLEPSTYSTSRVSDHLKGYFTGQLIPPPPLTVQQTMLIPGSRQWEASQGAYIVGAFNGNENPPTTPNYTQPLVQLTQVPEEYVSYYDGNFEYNSALWPNHGQLLLPVGTLTADAQLTLQATRIYPIQMCGAYLTGLSKETTLVLTQNLYIETFPTPAESGILTLATPSAPYDAKALEMLSVALSSLPVGVEVDQNYLGEWFAGAVKQVADAIAPALTVLHPALGAAAHAASGLAQAYMTSQTPQNVPNKQKKPSARKPPKSNSNRSTRKSKKKRSKRQVQYL